MNHWLTNDIGHKRRRENTVLNTFQVYHNYRFIECVSSVKCEQSTLTEDVSYDGLKLATPSHYLRTNRSFKFYLEPLLNVGKISRRLECINKTVTGAVVEQAFVLLQNLCFIIFEIFVFLL